MPLSQRPKRSLDAPERGPWQALPVLRRGIALGLWRWPDCGYLQAIATHSPGATETMIRLFSVRAAAAAVVLALMPLATLSGVATSPALAQPAASDRAAYADVASAMIEQIDVETLIEQGVMAVGRQFSSDPAFAKLDQENPGLIKEVLDAVRPVMAQMIKDGLALQRGEMENIFARHLTPEEATEIARFYRSPIGSKIVRGVPVDFALDALRADGTTHEVVDPAAFNAMVEQAAVAATAQLTVQEQAELAAMFAMTPALRKLEAIDPELKALELRMANKDITPAEDAAMGAAINGVFERRFGT